MFAPGLHATLAVDQPDTVVYPSARVSINLLGETGELWAIARINIEQELRGLGLAHEHSGPVHVHHSDSHFTPGSRWPWAT